MYLLKKLSAIILCIITMVSAKSQTCSYSTTHNYSTALDTDLVFKTIVYYNVQAFKYDTLTLKMDIIKPIGDNNTKRPIVVYFHGANESYKYSQLHVKRMVDVMVKERGFVLASVDYKFWGLPNIENTPPNCGNLLALLLGAYSPYDILEAQRANYRVAQDANDAIKFVTQRTSIDSSCANLCFLAGFSAGGLVAGTTTFLSPPEKPMAAGNIAPANYTNLFGSPLTPTVSISRPDLGPVYGNTNTFSPSIKGVMLFNSGLHNKNLIQQNDAPLFIYHSLNDPNIPADSSNPACIIDAKMYGQNSLKNQALAKGYLLNQNLVLLNGNTSHDFYDTQIRPAADFMNAQIAQLQCQCDTISATPVIETKPNEELAIYSNKNNIYIDGLSSEHLPINITVLDMLGKKIYSHEIYNELQREFKMDCQDGIYYIQLNTKDAIKIKKLHLTEK